MTSDHSTPLTHMVFFTLKDHSPAAQDALIEACRTNLADHPGLLHFSAGRRAESCQRPVNNTEFHVALVLIFASEADQDRYQVSERHQKFIAENWESWALVQVFDAFG